MTKCHPLESAFIRSLTVILLGYMFFGKGFAYLHINIGFPLYIGEIVLITGLLAAFKRPYLISDAIKTIPGKIYALFFVWGILRTIPYIGEYGINAGRDAALYYYGIFMLLVYGFFNGRTKIYRAVALYARPASVYVLWVPAVFVIHLLFKEFVPIVPGSDMPVIYFKGGDAIVHITGAVAFVVLLENILPRSIIGRKSMLWYMASVLSCLMLMVRAAYLAIICGLMTIVFLYGIKKIKKPLASAVIVITFLFIINPRITNPLSGFEMSPGIAFGLARSIFIDSADPRFRQGTKIWRLMWWHDIAEETVFGSFFWTGRGFGENLADAHGYQVLSADDPRPLRSPHNTHMTVLARMGVPGMLLWISLQGTLICGFYRGWKRAGERGDRFMQGVIGFVMCFWTAVMVNTSFDVFLEGPQGAIWFWSVAGFGLAATEMYIIPNHVKNNYI